MLFFSILFRHNTLFTCTSNNILLTFVFISSVFLRPVEHCKILNVRLQCGQWQATQRQGVTYFWQPVSHPTETRFDQIRCEKSNKTQLCLLCCGVCRGEGDLCITFKFEVFYSDSEVSVTHSKSLWPPKFQSYSCGPLENWCGPPL